MKNRLFDRLKRPAGFLLVTIYFFSAVFIAGAMVLVFADQTNPVIAVCAYLFYALAATSLAYTTYTIVIYAPGLGKRARQWAKKVPVLDKLLQNYNFRTLFLATISTLLTIFVAVVHAWLGVQQKSIWYGALAAYYILLILLKATVLLSQKRNDVCVGKAQKQQKSYRNCGVFLLVLNVALSSAIAQMIFDGRAFVYPGWTVIAFALYAFVKITVAIVNVVRATRYDNPVVQAIRNVNLADAFVSVLALQTALLWSFGDGNVDVSLFNTLTGCAVSFGTVAIGIIMIVRSKKILEKKDGQI
ncbi:MAG: hypothetical protein IJV77_05840 [Clostridia bacterium]|nr:hypothetical protein [Clostridia bacterium]